jgi:hypothetical protein
MGKLTFVISGNLEERFRKTVSNKMGFKHGNMGKALEEAINDWVVKNE